MKKIWVIAKKEYLAYLTSPVGYIFAGLLFLVGSWLFLADLFLLGQADLRPFWSVMGFLLSMFVPAIAMGLLAEEKRSGTWEIMLSLPVDEIELALGKFVGSGLYLISVMGLSLPLVASIFWLGKPDAGMVAGGLMGLILLGWAYLSVGIFASSLTDSPVVAFLVSAVFLIVNSLGAQQMVVSRVPRFLAGILENVSLSWRVNRFSAGLIDVGDVVFFVSWMMVFLLLTIMSLKTRDK